MDRMMHNDATKMSAWRHLQLSLWWPNLHLLDQVNNVRLNDMKNIKYWLLFQVHRTHWKSWLRKYKHPVKSHCLCVHSVFCTAHCALLFIFNPCMLFIFQAFIPKEVSACSLINKGPKQHMFDLIQFFNQICFLMRAQGFLPLPRIKSGIFCLPIKCLLPQQVGIFLWKTQLYT